MNFFIWWRLNLRFTLKNLILGEVSTKKVTFDFACGFFLATAGIPVSTLKPIPPAKKNSGGRPPKYDEPSKPVTVTLPESTLNGLKRIDPDRSQAIVKLTQNALRLGESPQSMVEIVEMKENTGLLVIGPSVALKKIPFLHFVEVAPARYILAMDPGNDFKNLELHIQDVLEEADETVEQEKPMLQELLESVKRMRKSERVTMAEILFVSLDVKANR